MTARNRSMLQILIVAAAVLTSAAWMRSAEYDEQYTLFVTGMVARPIWPADAFAAGAVRALQAAHAGFASIARDLRAVDVHPPLYFWVVSAWRAVAGDGLFAARLASVLFSVATLGAVAVIARLTAVPAGLAVLLTLGCYGFVYTGSIARGFALAEMLTVCGVALLLFAKERKQILPALVAGSLLGAATFTNYLAAFVGVAVLLWFAPSGIASSVSTSGGPSLDETSNAVTVQQKTPRPLAGEVAEQSSAGEGGFFLVSGAKQSQSNRAALLDRDTVALFAMTAAGVGFVAWLPADFWFFLEQRQSRVAQFAPFDVVSGVARLGQYAAANLVGGLPLYVNGTARSVVSVTLCLVLVGLLALTVWQWRYIATPGSRRLFAMAAVAPPIGLLLLGVAFNNMPIELRYLAYATPFVGLLLSGTFATLPQRAGLVCCGTLLAIQALALIGLMIRPETMQPARATAVAAASLAQDGVVLLPRGNDGVGIVGAFAIEAPPTLRLLVIGREATSEQIRARASRFPRVVLALLGQDTDSRTTLTAMRQAFDDACWREVGEGYNVLVYERICGE